MLPGDQLQQIVEIPFTQIENKPGRKKEAYMAFVQYAHETLRKVVYLGLKSLTGAILILQWDMLMYPVSILKILIS